MIQINNLTDKINELVTTVNAMFTEFKNHTHNVTAVGSPTGPILPVSTTEDAVSFDAKDYENDKFTH